MKILFLLLSLMFSFGVMGQATGTNDAADTGTSSVGDTGMLPGAQDGGQLCNCDRNRSGPGCTAADATTAGGDDATGTGTGTGAVGDP